MLIILAQNQKRLSTNQIAKIIKVSPLYLRQIALPLEQHGYIRSYRGAKGGYVIAKDPEKITLYGLFKVYKEDLDLIECISSKGEECCDRFEKCITKPYWLRLDNLFKKFLKETTLKAIIETT